MSTINPNNPNCACITCECCSCDPCMCDKCECCKCDDINKSADINNCADNSNCCCANKDENVPNNEVLPNLTEDILVLDLDKNKKQVTFFNRLYSYKWSILSVTVVAGGAAAWFLKYRK